MKKNYAIFLLFFGILIFSQNQRFIYEYKFVKDSTQMSQYETDLMYLDVTSTGSKYYSQEKSKNDSMMLEMRRTQDLSNMKLLKRPKTIYYVKKSYPKYDILFYDFIGMDMFKVTDNRAMRWEILTEKDKIGEFQVQKAILNFAGRSWIAWFTTDIPIQDGPYKFHGLPGLIVKIADINNSHVFELKAIKKLNNDIIGLTAEDVRGSSAISLDVNGYKKVFIENRNDPSIAIKGMARENIKVEMRDEDGNPVNMNDMIKDSEKRAKEYSVKNNNILELDMLR